VLAGHFKMDCRVDWWCDRFTEVVLPRLLQQTWGRVSRKSPAYHIDDRADGLERGAFMHEALLLKGVGRLPTTFRTVEVANAS
jgi:hypothetical protein